MALATKCQFIFNNLEKRTSLNTVIVCPKKPVEAHTFLTKCLCCLDHVLLLQNAKKPYEAHHVFLQNATAIFMMG